MRVSGLHPPRASACDCPLRRDSCPTPGPGAVPYNSRSHSRASVNLLADGLHNFADGVALAVAFHAGAGTAATTAAVVLHELPQARPLAQGPCGLLLNPTDSKALAMHVVAVRSHNARGGSAAGAG